MTYVEWRRGWRWGWKTVISQNLKVDLTVETSPRQVPNGVVLGTENGNCLKFLCNIARDFLEEKAVSFYQKEEKACSLVALYT